ncbi:unnamed protein product [Schistocephalus solidus]|uniref:Endo/exonuclease/phosphatase domain-containing protein n=1 Tax=Schistocephalus solidus TaxID=70667 RepID=A0A183T142_SCHSO|nr:unnamed protein product [Schistocephalus solidus]
MLLWPPLIGTQLSPVALQSWVLPSGHTPGNRHDRRAKLREGLRQSEEQLTGMKDGAGRSELTIHKVDIGALSETRLSEQGQMEEVTADSTFFWSSRSKAEAPPDPDQHLLLSPDAAEGDVHPQRRHRHLLDYVFVRRRDQLDVLVTKSIPSADGWTDHRLVISKMRLCLEQRRRPQASLPVTDEDVSVENRWCQLRDTALSTALDVLGRAHHQH